MKAISFAIPCYNSAAYMDTCIESIMACVDERDDIEIIIVDDGSTKDDTAVRADEWQKRHPSVIKAVHQPNGGHGEAVSTGLANATGLYFKVVDSDDWLDRDSLEKVLDYVRSQISVSEPTDLVIANYVYEKVHEGTHTTMRYRNVFPTERQFGWEDTKGFRQSQYLLMHSVIYRAQLLRDCGLKLPKHTFYVDNIFVYVPLPHVKTMYYLDADLYRYFIGREDQSVNQDVMYSRRDQQVRVTRAMIDAVDLDADVPSEKLRRYMRTYLSMMMAISSVFLRMHRTPENDAALESLWKYLAIRRPQLAPKIRHSLINAALNLPGEAGRRVGLAGYAVARRIFKFN